MKANTVIGGRLREERKRMKLKQADFAAFAGAARQTQSNYEKGRRSPDGEYFSAIAKAGADVQYILTGVRSCTSDHIVGTVIGEESANFDVNKPPQEEGTGNREVEILIEMCKRLSPENRAHARAVLAAFVDATVKKDKVDDG